MNACTTLGFAGSLVSMPCTPSCVHTGDRLPKILWPVNCHPPSTRSALVDDSSTGMSLPASPCPAAKISPVGCALEHPIARGVAGAVHVGAQPDEVVVHVDRDSGRRSDVGDASQHPVELTEVHPGAAVLGGQRGGEEATGAQLLEIVGEEAVGSVVRRRSFVEAGEHLVAQ